MTPNPLLKRGHVLVLAIESFGGSGGIAAYTRDLVNAYLADPRVASVTAVSRLPQAQIITPPTGVKMVFPKPSGVHYSLAVIREMLATKPAIIHCTHVNLAPLAEAVSRMFKVPWWLTLHGAEVWQPHRNRLVNYSASRADLYLPVSMLTLSRFTAAFAKTRSSAARLLSPSVDLARFCPERPSGAVRLRLGLGDRRLIVTIGRLNSSERAKGFDRVIAVLPALQRNFPDLAYVIAGSGDDASRLTRLAEELGVADSVFFAGYIAEKEKIDLYRSADAYVMPSTLEGFGIVFLEAMACGTACVASSRDAGAEAVRDFGEVVDPFEPDALIAAIGRAIESDTKAPGFIAEYSTQCFQHRLGAILNDYSSLGLVRN